MNQFIINITIKATPAVNPDAKTVNLEVINAEYKTESRKKKTITIYDLTEQDPIILMGYARLRNKGDRITVKNITFELKSLLDDKKITEDVYRQALMKLKTVDKSD